MKCINFFGGPGIGKSTSALELSTEMKKKHYSVEYIDEYAKYLVYTENFKTLGDQIKIFGEQHHKFWILKNKVDYCISDGSFLLSLIYKQADLPLSFDRLVLDVFNSYDNYNIILKRKHPYQEYGRLQTIDEAEVIDKQVKDLFDKYSIDYTELDTVSLEQLIKEGIIK